MKTLIYVLELVCQDVNVAVKLNGISIIHESVTSVKTVQQKVNTYLQPGVNIVDLVLNYNTIESTPKCKLALLSGKKGTMPGEETIELGVEWPEAILDQTETNVTEHKQLKFNASSDEIKPFWSKAGDVDSIGKAKSDAIKKLHELDGFVSNSDLTSIAKLLELKNEINAEALGSEPKIFTEGQKQFLEYMYSNGPVEMAPIVEQNLEFSLGADGKVLSVNYRGFGDYVIRIGNGNQSMDFNPNFMFVGDKLEIVP